MNNLFGVSGNVLRTFFDDDSGTTAIEYTLIAAGISVAIATVVGIIGSDVNSMFVEVESKF